MDYTQTLLDSLVGCPKRIRELSKTVTKNDRAYSQRTAILESLEIEGSFEMFLRQNNELPEDFSVGLLYKPLDEGKKITLLRCNGDHGRHINRVGDGNIIEGMHIHKATEIAIEAQLKPEHVAFQPTGYTTLEEAVQVFLRLTNVLNAEEFFPQRQIGLFGDDAD